MVYHHMICFSLLLRDIVFATLNRLAYLCLYTSKFDNNKLVTSLILILVSFYLFLLSLRKIFKKTLRKISNTLTFKSLQKRTTSTFDTSRYVPC